MVHDLAKITGADTNPHALLSVRTSACWVQLIADPGNTSPVNVGGPTLATGRGLPIAKGAGQLFPPVADINSYDLQKIFYQFGTINDVLWVTYHTR